MKLTVLTSGSKGNCSCLQCPSATILIDIGLTYHRLSKDLEMLHLTIDDIDALLLTHTHKDHILGLAVAIKHSHFPIYITEEMYPEIKDIIPKERIEFYQPVSTHIAAVSIQTIRISHDAPGAVGFVIESNDHSLVYITDTGYIHKKYFPLLSNREIYYLESNHDEKMLMDGPYPYVIKQRIISDEGHLSNETAAGYLESLVGNKTKYIILAHLSEHNNTAELALTAAREHLAQTSYQPKIIVANAQEISELVEV